VSAAAHTKGIDLLDPPSNADVLSIQELEFCGIGWRGGDLKAKDEECGGVEDLFYLCVRERQDKVVDGAIEMFARVRFLRRYDKIE